MISVLHTNDVKQLSWIKGDTNLPEIININRPDGESKYFAKVCDAWHVNSARHICMLGLTTNGI